MRVAAALLLVTVLATAAHAAQQPLWEFGLGIGGVVFNDYRGAAAMHGYPVPVPYFVYRGQLLRSEQAGLHGRFLNRRYLEFDISLNATAPVLKMVTAAPPTVGSSRCSRTSTRWPRLLKALAVASPPGPAPMTRISMTPQSPLLAPTNQRLSFAQASR